MKKYVKKVSVIILALLVSLAMVMPVSAASVSLNRRSASVTVGKTVKLKVKGTRKKAKWSSSNSKIATVNKNGVVKGKKTGQVKITAKIGKKKLTCKVNVKKAKSKAKPKAKSNTNTAQNTNVRKVVSKGMTYDHGITYEAYLYNDRTIEVEVTNGNNSSIAFGWLASDFNMSVKTTAGTYNVPVNILKSIENGGVNYQRVQPGAKSGWIITLGNKLPGNVQSVIFSGIYPLNANGLPVFDGSSRTYINYSVSMNLR